MKNRYQVKLGLAAVCLFTLMSCTGYGDAVVAKMCKDAAGKVALDAVVRDTIKNSNNPSLFVLNAGLRLTDVPRELIAFFEMRSSNSLFSSCLVRPEETDTVLTFLQRGLSSDKPVKEIEVDLAVSDLAERYPMLFLALLRDLTVADPTFFRDMKAAMGDPIKEPVLIQTRTSRRFTTRIAGYALMAFTFGGSLYGTFYWGQNSVQPPPNKEPQIREIVQPPPPAKIIYAKKSSVSELQTGTYELQTIVEEKLAKLRTVSILRREVLSPNKTTPRIQIRLTFDRNFETPGTQLDFNFLESGDDHSFAPHDRRLPEEERGANDSNYGMLKIVSPTRFLLLSTERALPDGTPIPVLDYVKKVTP